jgi:hypothetical protein
MQQFSVFSISTTFVAIFVLLSASHSTYGKPYGDDNNDLYNNDDYTDPDGNGGHQQDDSRTDESVIYKLPKFVTKPQNLMVNEGSTIRLPCVVDRLEGFVILWKKGDEILVVGEQVIKEENKRRFQLVKEADGASLVISLAEEKDEGKYVCQISTYKPTEIKHTVKIRVKPEVRPVPDNGIIITETGKSVTLECEVTRGFPTPEVSWHRRERKMPSGEESIRGLSITYTAVTRHHSGVYICDADNGFGDTTSAILKLDVQHQPEIEQEETFIHTQEGDETEVICVVHSSPKADVKWFKDGTPLDVGTHILNDIGNRHTLTLPVAGEDAFGQYTCQAENQYGKSSKTTEVSGLAELANIKSNPKGDEGDRFQLEWVANSYSPITTFKIEYKAVGEEIWRSDEAPAYPINAGEEKPRYTGTYMIARFKPATVYMARVSSQNNYGYSHPSEVFKFATRGADPVQRGQLSGNGGGAAPMKTTLLLGLSSSLALLFLL